jgi:hypothetical protein
LESGAEIGDEGVEDAFEIIADINEKWVTCDFVDVC